MQNNPQATYGKLQQIIERKRGDIAKLKKSNDFFKQHVTTAKGVALLCEIKLASPTEPKLGSEKDIINRAVLYEKAGADAISFITESHFFKGDIRFIPQLKSRVKIPVLHKDFVIDPIQIYEAKFAGSDAILLIAKLIDKKTLHSFVKLCFEIGIEPVVEVNDEDDLKKSEGCGATIIAVNARDLTTFQVDVAKACSLLSRIPDPVIKLGFSGIQTANEVRQYNDAGARGVLVGTNLMKVKNIQKFIHDLKTL